MIRSRIFGGLTFVVVLLLLLFHGSLVVGSTAYRDPFTMIAATNGFQTRPMIASFMLTVVTGVALIPPLLIHIIQNHHLSFWQKLAWLMGVCTGYAMPIYWLLHISNPSDSGQRFPDAP